MREHEISSPSELDAALAAKALSRQQRLWKAASGQSLRWPDVLMAVLGVTQFFLGAYGVLSEGEPYSIVLLAFGILFVAFALWRLQESRIDALHELIRSIESGRR